MYADCRTGEFSYSDCILSHWWAFKTCLHTVAPVNFRNVLAYCRTGELLKRACILSHWWAFKTCLHTVAPVNFQNVLANCRTGELSKRACILSHRWAFKTCLYTVAPVSFQNVLAYCRTGGLGSLTISTYWCRLNYQLIQTHEYTFTHITYFTDLNVYTLTDTQLLYSMFCEKQRSTLTYSFTCTHKQNRADVGLQTCC